MKIVIAPDKFKGCLSAMQVAQAMARGVRDAATDAEIDLCPMADGGEGTVDAMVAATGGKLVTRRVTGPLPEMKVDATFGILGKKVPDTFLPSWKRCQEPFSEPTAVIEMAAASGLALLASDQRDPLATTTFGTGELLLAAAEMGAKQIILGIGGSATVDGGIGCAQGAGLTVLRRDGAPVSPTEPLCGRDLPDILMIKNGRGSIVDRVRITVACDVTNPLFGDNGAAPIFGPQKGATPEQVRRLDNELRALAERTGKLAQANVPGAGAAGGLGFGMLAFFGATLKPGINLITDAVNLRDRLRDANLCLTGEGKLDAQSLSGKTAIGVARICRELSVPCVALVGAIEGELDRAYVEGLTACFSICDRPMSLDDAMHRAELLLRDTTMNVIRSIRALSPA